MATDIDPDLNEQIQAFVDAPFGALRIKFLRVGRVIFRDLEILGREAANSLYNLIELICVRTQRNRVRKDGTRYIDVLPPGTPGRLLSEETADYLADMRRRKLAPKTIEKTSRTLAILKMTTGDIEVSRIDYKHLHRMWELLRWAPSKLCSDPALKNQTAQALIDLGIAAGKQELSWETLDLHHRTLCAFFNSLVDHDAITRSPMKGFPGAKKPMIVRTRKVLRLFGDGDLSRIFEPKSFTNWAHESPHRWWCPILALYTGARISEIAQLHVEDVFERNGSLFIQIHAVEDPDLAHMKVKSRMVVKGESSIRSIPLSEPVMAAGFADFLADLKAHGHRRLFPHLSAGVNRKTGETNARYSASIQRDFGDYLKTLGFAKGVSFHAFRHTLATDLDDQGVHETEVALITGHSVESQAPVLRDAYLHPGSRKPVHRQQRQKKTLKLYRPKVQVPVYRAGQFDKVLAPGNVFYP